jgi:hypothetical protein
VTETRFVSATSESRGIAISTYQSPTAHSRRQCGRPTGDVDRGIAQDSIALVLALGRIPCQDKQLGHAERRGWTGVHFDVAVFGFISDELFILALGSAFVAEPLLLFWPALPMRPK